MTWTHANHGVAAVFINLNPAEWTPSTITYPAVGVYDPDEVHLIISPDSNYDPGINNSQQLVHSSLMALSTIVGCTSIQDATPWRRLHARMTTKIMIKSTYDVPCHAGIVGLASDVVMAQNGGGKGYGWFLDTLLGLNRVRLVAITDGLSGFIGGAQGSDYVLLAETDTGYFSAGQVINLALEWESDPRILRGVRLQAYYSVGTQPLVKIYDIVYNGTGAYIPDEPTAGAGLLMGTATNSIVVYYDNTTIA